MGKDSSSTSRSSKPEKHSSKHSKPGSSRNKNHRHAGNTGAPLSFFFVVNDVSITHCLTDMWHNRCPPTNPEAYHSETPSLVMRYHDGTIQPVPNNRLYWYREQPGSRGAICGLASDGGAIIAETYKTATIFSCHPLMPFAMVNRDATVELTRTRADGNGVEGYNWDGNVQDNVWEPLQFYFPRDSQNNITGVSQAVFSSMLTTDFPGGGVNKYVAGRPSWIPSLVPETYRNPYENRRSAGLGGDLTILLGLMAFSSPRDTAGVARANQVFSNGLWQNNRWRGPERPRGYTRSTNEDPQGLVITIALDPFNPEGSTREALWDFEFCRVPVEG